MLTCFQVVGPYEDRARIPEIDIALKDGDKWLLEDLEFEVLHTPGHTTGTQTSYCFLPRALSDCWRVVGLDLVTKGFALVRLW